MREPYRRGVVAARFDDVRSGDGWLFPEAQEVIRASTIEEVIPALVAVDQATRAGRWAYGFVCYEAAPAFDPALTVRAVDGASPVSPHTTGRLPLVWFAITEPPTSSTLADLPDTGPYRIDATSPRHLQGGALDARWGWDWTESEHAERVARVQDAIAAGETYQCNLTTRLRARFSGDPTSWYRDLAARQHGGFHGLLDTGDHTVVSASPEGFLTWQGNRLTVVPMKGTAPRGVDHDSDRWLRDELRTSGKERAENVMIVDLVRNDLSRIALPGTVRTTRLLDCERYRTVWQLTSTVTADVPPVAGLADMFGALFPCGSVTGAPKARTMALIADLEDEARGVYCGAIGWVAPPTEPTRARFSVAIRTAVIDNATGDVVYGVGGGITWDSTAPAEFAELATKAHVVTTADPGDDHPFAVLETMAVRSGHIDHLDRHRTRLLATADWFDIGVDHGRLESLLTELARGPDRIVRLRLHRDGSLEHDSRPLPSPASAPTRLALDTVATPDSAWRRHKTTRRTAFELARQRHPHVDDVIMVNAAGRITETTIANIAVRLDGRWCTPPVTDGLLPGVGRAAMLAEGRLTQRSVPADELPRATGLALISAVRGWRPAQLVAGTAHGRDGSPSARR